jgi:hypothetical protein
MDEELKSFLCKGVWGFDPSESYLIFKEDNTGKVCTSLYHISFDDIKYSEQLVVSSGLCKLICSEFKWKSTIITPLDLTNASNDNKAPRLIGQLNRANLSIGAASLTMLSDRNLSLSTLRMARSRHLSLVTLNRRE